MRGGGHSAPGFGTNDGGVVIDLSPMRTSHVDPPSAHGARRRRRHLGRLQLRHPRLRAGDDRRDRLDHGHRRPHAGRRHRLPDPRLRPVDRQPDLRRRGHRRRAGAAPRARRENDGPVLGAARRRRQLRRRHVVRVPAAPGRRRLRRAVLLRARARRRRCCASSASSSGTRPRSYGAFPAFQIAPPLPFIPEDRHGDTFCARGGALGRAARRGREGDEAVPRRSRRVVAEMVGPDALPGAQRRVRRALPEGHPQLLEGQLRQRAHRRRDRGARRARAEGARGQRDHAPVSDQRRLPPRRPPTTPRSPTGTPPSPP